MMTQEEKKALSISLVIGLIYSLPLILWGGFYIDDMARAIGGQTGWSINGRPLADLLFDFFNFGKINADSSPFPQILAVMLTSTSSFLAWRRFIPESGLSGALLASPLMLSPFYLENISFRYDSATMALSFLLSVIPFTIDIKNQKLKFLFSILCLISSLSLYQASISVYITFATLTYLSDEEDNSFNKLLLSALSLLVGYLLYSSLIASNFLSGDYNIKHSEIIGITNSNSPDIIIYNASQFYKIFESAFSGWYALSLTVIFFMALASIIIITLNDFGNKRYLNSLITIFCIPVLLFSCAGPSLLLKEPLFSPRVMMGFGCVIFSLVVVTYKKLTKLHLVLKIMLISQILACIMFSYTLANTLKYQHEYEKFISGQVVNDLFINDLQNINDFTVVGSIWTSPQGIISTKKYPLIRYLIPRLVVEGSGWGEVRFKHMGLNLRYSSPAIRAEAIKDLCKKNLVKRSNFYNIYLYKRTAILDFSKHCT